MVQEEKAIAYDEALQRTRRWYDSNTNEGYRAIFEDIFPELKESEDERIRKGLIDFLEYYRLNNVLDSKTISLLTDSVAWLEKQGEQKSIDDLTQQEAMDIAVAKCFDEQKPADKVEPKFHEGEWITNGKLLVGQVTSFDGEYYHYLQDGIEQPLHVSNAHNWHLWTIQDAKAGDVLRIRKLTFIFQEITNNNACHKDAVVAYCSYEDNDDGFGVCGPDCITDLEIITPATKEQRNLLFQKMKEAGYEWNAEKKELKKIEQPKLSAFEEAIKDMMDDYKDAIGDNNATTEEVKKTF